MAFGLVFRSRRSWALTLMISAISLALLLHRYQHLSVAMLIFNGLILLGLLIFRRHFSRSSVAAGTLFAFLSIVLLLSYAVFGSYVLGAGFSPQIKSLDSALYFAVVTMSTVGYGDIVPKSPEARYFVISIIILGITVFATSISAVVVPLINGRMQRLLLGEKKSDWSDHYVLIGDNLFAQNTYRALRRRHLLVRHHHPPPPRQYLREPLQHARPDPDRIRPLTKRDLDLCRHNGVRKYPLLPDLSIPMRLAPGRDNPSPPFPVVSFSTALWYRPPP